MTDDNYTATILLDRSPIDVFNAIVNIHGWWHGDIQGHSRRIGDSFTYRYADLHRSTQLVTEFVPGHRLVWRVTDAELGFVEDKTEWTGTDIVFDIARKGDKTELRFTHVGLRPSVECYNDCSNAWGGYITGSLKTLIEQRAAA
jgi:uncharacterized protein YndB with AHSA1/START domain